MGLKFSEDHPIRKRARKSRWFPSAGALYGLCLPRKNTAEIAATPGGSTMTDPKMGLFVRLPQVLAIWGNNWNHHQPVDLGTPFSDFIFLMSFFWGVKICKFFCYVVSLTKGQDSSPKQRKAFWKESTAGQLIYSWLVVSHIFYFPQYIYIYIIIYIYIFLQISAT